MWLPQIIRMTWYLTVINFVLGIHGQIDGDLGGPFFYSRTSCCGQSGTPKELPQIYDVHYPDTFNNFHVNTTYIRACSVPLLDPEDPYWSHSAYCPNWDYVRAFTQKLGAGRSMTLTMMSLFCMPIGAGFADKRGRKPMFVFGFMLGCARNVALSGRLAPSGASHLTHFFCAMQREESVPQPGLLHTVVNPHRHAGVHSVRLGYPVWYGFRMRTGLYGDDGGPDPG
jgi:hypothetical protein